MKITFEQLKQICPALPKNADVFIPYLNETMQHYEINTVKRVAAFIAQLAHESLQFKYTQEIASGKAYEGRKDLGNVFKGDGMRYKGRGFIQVTGRANYHAMSKVFGVDFIANPTLLQTPRWACLVSGEYWKIRKLNEFADLDDNWRSKNRQYTPFQYITFRINGGLNGYADRLHFYQKALQVLL